MSGSYTACNLSRTLRTCDAPFSPVTLPGPTTSTTPCCTVPVSHKLRVYVLGVTPWSKIPGAGTNPGCPSACGPSSAAATIPNQPPSQCQIPITPGMPYCAKLGTLGNGIPYFAPMSAQVKADFPGKYNVNQFLFNFGFRSPEFRTGAGSLLAFGQKGGAQAQLDFTYSWLGAVGSAPACSDDAGACFGPLTTAVFTVTGCTTKNLRFTVLATYMSSDPCVESEVVVMVQQYQTVMDADTVPGVGEVNQLSDPCSYGQMTCLVSAPFKKCTRPCGGMAIQQCTL